MKHFIESQLDKLRPMFEEGASLHWAWPIFEAQETVLLTTKAKTSSGAHVRDPMDMKRLMIFVLYALFPAILMAWYNTGYQGYLAEGITDPGMLDCLMRGGWAMLPIIIMSYVAGGIAELVFCIVRSHEVNEGFLVTAMLFPLTLPSTMPLWMVAISIVFGVIIGKEVFGGVGMNILNPALTARAFAFFTYPAAISGAALVENGKLHGVWDVGANDMFATGAVVDGYTGATPLLTASSGAPGSDAVSLLAERGWDWMDLAIGLIPGSMGEVSAFAILLGAIFLVVTGVASLRVMLSTVAGLFFTVTIFNFFAGPESVSMMTLPFHYHLVMGGFMFGTVFMATDPCSSAVTPIGKIIYGFMIGVLCALVRVVNPAYPEGMMLSILFMNLFAPLIDYYVVRSTTRRRLARMATAN